MALIPNKFGNNDSKSPNDEPNLTSSALLSYVVEKVRTAREARDAQFEKRWAEYTRLWRGFYKDSDSTTASERSKLISPATQQAVEMTASEMEEATFGRTAWFDVQDDIADEQKDDAAAYRDQLLEDFELAGAMDGITDTYLLGCVYGTGISKLNVGLKRQRHFDGTAEDKFIVTVEAVRPDEFVIDPTATSIDAAQFVAHEVIKPKHGIKSKQAQGVYRKGRVDSYTGVKRANPDGLSSDSQDPAADGVLVTEFFGLVPAVLLPDAADDNFGMVEAIVTIANEQTILRAVESPFTNQDRPFVSYQHDSIPGEFWGRGVVEKGYNPQKALDAELRARIDALGLMSAPMMGADITRMPRNPDLRTKPGKFFLTRGRPSEIIEPISFNAPALSATFQNAGDLERMVSMATGAMDSAMPVAGNRRNETSGGMSQMNSAFLKRSKRTMRRVEKYLDTIVRRSLWRFMQFDGQRYPQDMKFIVNSTMGLMAREVENQQLVQMLGFVPDNSPAQNIIIQALFENTNSADKLTLKEAIKQMNAPPSEEEKQLQQMKQQIEMEMMKQQLREQTAKADKLEAESVFTMERAKHTAIVADLEDDKVDIAAANAATGAEKARQTARQNDVAIAKVAVENKKINSAKAQ